MMKWKFNSGILSIAVLTLLIAGILSPFASPQPDGLEVVAEKLGFSERGKIIQPPVIPDYVFPGIESELLATAISGIAGSVIMFFVTLFLFKILKKQNSPF